MMTYSYDLANPSILSLSLNGASNSPISLLSNLARLILDGIISSAGTEVGFITSSLFVRLSVSNS